jgi:hypothetical protein
MAVENDIVLIYMEEEPLSFARIESIEPDHKPNWYHVKLLLLQVPLQVVTWILRDVYIDGEPYAMGGKSMRIEKVICPPDPPAESEDETPADPPPGSGKVISLADLKKR